AVLLGARHVVPEKVIDEAADRREAAVARAGTVSSLGLDVVEEREYRVGADVVEMEQCDRLCSAAGDEHEEQPQRVAVRTDGVPARAADSLEVVAKEALHVSK